MPSGIYERNNEYIRVRQLNEPKRAYIAGFFDGEGSITIIKHKPNSKFRMKNCYYTLQVQITNTNKEIIEWLHFRVGGHISNNSHCPSRKRQRPCWAWRVIAQEAKVFLEAIEPYAIVKKRQIQLAIDFQEHKNATNKIMSPDILQERNRYKEEISKLNLGYRTL
jgi:LAGLIDADG endonuclease.